MPEDIPLNGTHLGRGIAMNNFQWEQSVLSSQQSARKRFKTREDLPQAPQDPRHRGAEEAEGLKDTGENVIRRCRDQGKTEPKCEETPEGWEERAEAHRRCRTDNFKGSDTGDMSGCG
jgi:hypothetical protein